MGAISAPKHVAGSSIAHDLRAGRTVIEAGVVVDGPLDLGKTRLVRGLFRCRECTFRGRLAAPDVTFARTVDLTGSTFRRPVDFRGTTFRGPALFRAAPAETKGGAGDRPSRFLAGGDFSLAVFEDFASFKGSELNGAAVFRDTRFTHVSFGGAIFDSATFDGGSFRGAARFNGAVFTNAARFGETDFSDRTNFSLSVFQSGAAFTGSHFSDGASFLAAEFASSAEGEEAARFDSVASPGNLDFTFARFVGGDEQADEPSVVAVFSDLVCGRSLVLRDAVFPEDGRLAMDRLQVRDLVMEIDAVALIEDGARGERRRVLEAIEESAKARDDLAEANDAHYRLQVMQSKEHGAVVRALDYVFYRGVAGYFVRPLRPLLVLLGLVLVVAVGRELRGGRPSEAQPSSSRVRRVWRHGRERGAGLLAHVLNTFALLGPRRGEGEPTLSERLEAFAYRLLAVCALLGLANSNPTLRQMVDTLF